MLKSRIDKSRKEITMGRGLGIVGVVIVVLIVLWIVGVI
jgi:hypothetical protein